jgi:mercuric reductase
MTSTEGQDLVRYRMTVEGMTCSDCEHHVADALREAGALEPVASFRRGEAIFSAPADLEPARFGEAFTPTPYRATTVERIDPERVEKQPVGRGGPERLNLAVVGSGGGAFAAAITAVELGASVVMIERGVLGGTCVNVGCVPSKTQLRAGELFWQAGHHPFRGVPAVADAVDLPPLVDEKDELVARLRKEKYEHLIAAYGWELIQGEANFADSRTLQVNGRFIRPDGVILATGARPAVPPIPGLDQVEYLTSASLLDLKTLPEHLIVIGAGYVGLELGQLFRHLGSRVTLVQRGRQLLKEFDTEIGNVVHEALVDEGIDVLAGVTYTRVEEHDGRKLLTVMVDGHSRTIEGDALLVATGRTPNTETLNLAGAGVQTGAQGEIVVDEYMQTSNPRVFAAGDVTLGPQFVYVAAHEGAVAAENALGGTRAVNLRAVPGVIFTRPSIATVGLTEEAARRAGREPRTSVLPLESVPRALVNRDTRGLFKIVADAQSDEVLGVHIVAENAGDVIHSAVLAVRFHLTVRDLADTFAPYLTMSEGLKLAAQTFDRDVSKLSCCAA